MNIKQFKEMIDVLDESISTSQQFAAASFRVTLASGGDVRVVEGVIPSDQARGLLMKGFRVDALRIGACVDKDPKSKVSFCRKEAESA